MSAAEQIRYERFYDPRLSATQNKAVEMIHNGISRPEIVEELGLTSGNCLSTLLCDARRRGVPVPRAKGGQDHDSCVRRGITSIERLVQIRKELLAAGYKKSVTAMIAERCNMTRGCVAVRLWRYDNERRGDR